ncbi:IS5 family transposase [Streptomyces aquilus]|uniref:IS5 family transposase n=1 Tax=Streptomyces aquilus TaxID=2548456 RepID=UPI003CC50C2E
MRRRELTDESWAVIEPLLAPARMGRPVRDRRQVANGILWKLSTGAAWRDLPERFGPCKTVYERFHRWSADGTWDRLPAHVQQYSDAVGAVDWSIVCVDSTTVRAHQHAAGTPHRRERQRLHPVRGGHGPHQDRARRAGPSPDQTGAGSRGQGLLSSVKLRAYLRRRGIKAAIPERIDQINGRIRRGERRSHLDRAAYRRRNVVERCFNKLKHHKALATRYDKRARHYPAMVTLACLQLWLP